MIMAPGIHCMSPLRILAFGLETDGIVLSFATPCLISRISRLIQLAAVVRAVTLHTLLCFQINPLTSVYSCLLHCFFQMFHTEEKQLHYSLVAERSLLKDTIIVL